MRSLTPLLALVFTALFLSACDSDAPSPGTYDTAPSADTAPAVPSGATTGLDTDAIARRLVTESAGVDAGDIVMISGGVRDLRLLEDLAVQVRRLGAFPLLTVSSDRLVRRLWDDVDPSLDSQEPVLGLELTEIADVMISVDFGETDDLLAHIPPERRAARAAANQVTQELASERGIRFVSLGNGLYPTASLAERFGMPSEDLSRIFWEGVGADPAELARRGEAVRSVLEGSSDLHVTGPDGTDLRVRIEDRPIFVSDGRISAEDRARGGSATQVWLPAGEVYLTPVPGSAEGTIFVERYFVDGREIRDLTLTFAGGVMTGMTAASGIEPLQALYDAAGEGRGEFAFVNFGINPGVSIPEGSRMQAWMPAGIVTLGVGNNAWAGGTNRTPFSIAAHLKGTTVSVDGTLLVEDGVLRP
jgi:leucyl aminopeptidase (aminopeptidase T)